MALKSVVGDDGGSANLDCLTISLPRLKEEKVIDAVKKAYQKIARERGKL